MSTIVTLVSIGLLLCSGAASAQDSARVCAQGRVRIEGSLNERWLASIARVCEELPAMKDVDPSAQLRIKPDGDAIELEATLGDGRRTSRRVRTPDELGWTVEALTVIPAQAPPIDLTPAPAAPLEPLHAAAPTPRLADEPVDRALSIELGALLGGRLSRAPTYLSPSLVGYAGIRIRDWLFGLTLRWDLLDALVASSIPHDFEMESVGAGFSIAKRLVASESVGLDLGANALLLAEKQSLQGMRMERSDVDPDIRVGAFSRLSLGRSAWRWALALDAEFSPLHLRHTRSFEPDAPSLPKWSVGLGIGAAWSGP
jgi:hypothetical protein